MGKIKSLIIGNEHRIKKVLKTRKEISEENKDNYDIVVKLINAVKFPIGVDIANESIFKDVQVKNKELKIGDSINIERWDWNGISNKEEIINFELISDGICKIITKKGSVLFSTNFENNAEVFEWSTQQKDKWIRENIWNVNLTNCYIKIKAV
jgi:hypothetical protein